MRFNKKDSVLLCSFLLFFTLTSLFSQTTSSDSARELYQNGVIAHQRLDRFQAYEYFHAAIRINPDYVAPVRGLAFLLFEMRQYNQAMEYVYQAQKLDRYDISLKNLEGRILIGLAEFDKAREAFAEVLKKEPNNVEARLGISDLDVVYGTWRKAITGYQEILRSYPQNIRAMLSLVLIYDELKNETSSENFIKKSIRLYPDDVSVRYLAASHYRKYGRILEAEKQARLALKIDPLYKDAAMLLAYIMLDDEKYTDAVSLLTPLIQAVDDDFVILYTLAYALQKSGEIDEAIRIYYRALDIRINDEVTRAALEYCVINNTGFESEDRSYLANWHFDRGEQFLSRSKVNRYYHSYRKGLQIKNMDYRGLKGFSEYFRINGNSSKYLTVLEELTRIDSSDRDVMDNYKIYKRLTEKSVSLQWKIDQFSTIRDDFTLSFYALNRPRQVIHYDSQNIMLEYFTHIMKGHLNVSVRKGGKSVDGFAQAFKDAGKNGSDYFFIMDMTEKERSIYIKIDIFYSKSGILLGSFSVLETGNDRLQKSMSYIAEKMAGSLPKKGRLVRFEFDKGIINLGKMDGLKPGDKLFIIRKGMLSIGNKGFTFDYDDNNVLGTFHVTEVDDLICEGTVEKRFYYDLINEDDHVIMMPEGVDELSLSGFMPPDLYKELLKLR